MLPLTLDGEIKDLVFMYKALFGFINVNINNYVSFVSHDRTRSSQSSKYILQIQRCRTSTFQSSYYNRIVKPGTLYVKKLAWTKSVLPAPSNIYSNVDTQTFSLPLRMNLLHAHLNELENELVLVLYYNYKFGIFKRLFYIRYTSHFIITLSSKSGWVPRMVYYAPFVLSRLGTTFLCMLHMLSLVNII